MGNPFLAVMVPTRGTVFTKAVIALQRELAPYDHAFFWTTDLPIPDCRNRMKDQAVNSDLPFTHALLVDDDVVLPPGGLKAMLDAGSDVAVIDYPSHFRGKNANLGTAVYTKDQLLFAGLGCVLVRFDRFRALPEFRKGGQFMDVAKDGSKVLYGKTSHNDGGEDFEFFQDCRASGLSVTVVKDMVAGHAKILKHIGVVTPGKYVSQHDIEIADKIDKPLK